MTPTGLHRPSPAMVVATIALIVALGGTAVARTVRHLVSGDTVIQKGSLSGNRLRAHTITARQIRFSKLGAVPKARTANRARFATNATHATSATLAANAGSLSGMAQSAFERSTRIMFGAADNTNAQQTVLFSWPAMGLEVRTRGSTGANTPQIRVVSTRAAGRSLIKVTGRDGNNDQIALDLAPGANSEIGSTLGADLRVIASDDNGAAGEGRSVLIECEANDFLADSDGFIHCFGIRSAAS
jgi:hypothetical protein